MSGRQAMPVMAILAGGLATRLYPITETIPKLLLPIGEKLFVDHLFSLLRRNGIREVVLCIGHLADQIENYVGDGGAYGLSVKYSYDGPNLMGTGGAIRRALPLLDQEFFVLYGDSYLDVSYQGIYSEHCKSRKKGLMTVLHNEDKWDASNIEFKDGQVICYDKKNKKPEMKHIDFGLSVLKAQALERFSDDEAFDLVDVFQCLISDGEMSGYLVHQRFYEVGSLDGISELTKYLEEKIQK